MIHGPTRAKMSFEHCQISPLFFFLMPIWQLCNLQLGKVVGLTGFVIIHVFIASFSPAQGERNQMVNTKFTRPVNEMPMSNGNDEKRPPPSLKRFASSAMDSVVGDEERLSSLLN